MSQPCNRDADVPLPGKLDPLLKEFWVTNPFEIASKGHNLSCFERKRMYLNVKGETFVEVSHLSGADNDGDGRSVVAADFRNSGMLDLIIRQAGGGPVLLYENRLPPKSYLSVSLRGRTSNRQGIGARLTAEVQGRSIVREMYPANGYRSQAPNLVHFGLGDATRVDALTIRWPSGKVQVLKDVAAGRQIVVDESKEGEAAIELVTAGRTISP